MLGDRLLEAALSRSLSSTADTPFSHHAEQAGFQYGQLGTVLGPFCRATPPCMTQPSVDSRSDASLLNGEGGVCASPIER